MAGHDDADDIGTLAPCSESGAMPLYLIALGGFIKVALAGLAYHKEKEFLAQGGLGTTEDERRRQQFRAAQAQEGEKARTAEEGQIKFSKYEKLKFRILDITVRLYLIYGLFAIPVQVVLDIYHVAKSGVPKGWDRYQCYTQILLNSPNVGNIAMQILLPVAKYEEDADDSDEFEFLFGGQQTSVNRWLAFFRLLISVVLTAIYVAPIVTHFIPFVFVIYFWVTISLLIAILIFHGLASWIFWKATNKELADYIGERFIGYVVVVGVMVIVLCPIAGSTMVHWYSKPKNYIEVLKAALTERTTKRYLHGEFHRVGNVFSYFHFFL